MWGADVMTCARRHGVAVAFIGIMLATRAVAAPQSADQQRCLNALTKAGADVVKQQGKSDWKCVRNATRGKVVNLEHDHVPAVTTALVQ